MNFENKNKNLITTAIVREIVFVVHKFEEA